MAISKDFGEIHLVFDRYIHGSLKARTRNHRTSGKEVRYKVRDETNLVNVSMKSFLSHIETKQELTIFLANKVIQHLFKIGIPFVITFDTKSVTNIDNLSINMDLHDHEEADTLLVLHAIEVAQRSPFTECVIYSPDTDVFLLLVHYYPKLPPATKFQTGRGNDSRLIDIGNCFEAIGPLRASAVLGFHTFTGCDQTGKFCGKSKSSCWKVFTKCDDTQLEALAALGSSEPLPSLQTLEALEAFVVQLYSGNNCPEHIATLPQLRWYMYSKFQTQTEKLPPTMSALKYKIFRCHFITMVLKRSHVAFQHLPLPESFGWERTDDALTPIMTDSLPAPIALIELSTCSCKSSCKTKRCRCKKYGLVCTDMCKCKNCQNNGESDDDFEIDSNDEDLE